MPRAKKTNLSFSQLNILQRGFTNSKICPHENNLPVFVWVAMCLESIFKKLYLLREAYFRVEFW